MIGSAALVVAIVVLNIVDDHSDNVWFCNVMGWHREPKEKIFTGATQKGMCPRCGEETIQNGAGSWI